MAAKPPYGFKPGVSGNPSGRPKGIPNKFSKIKADWLKAYKKGGGVAYWEKLAVEDLPSFMKLGVSMLPKEINADLSGDLIVRLVQFAGSDDTE